MFGNRKVERTVMVHFRLTESEKIRFDRMMAEEGYRCTSRFVRDRVFRVRTSSGGARGVGSSDGSQSCSGGVSPALLAHVRRIGVNVNTACRNINSAASRSADGHLDRSMEYWLRKVSGYLYRIESLIADGDTAAKKDENESGNGSGDGNETST